MKLRSLAFILIVSTVLTLFYSHPAFAASNLTVSSSDNVNFVLKGEGMENVAALDITINYDASTLANPRVTKGGLIPGALMAVNPNGPATVRMVIITTSPINGDGTIVSLAFDQVGNSPGRIIAIKASISKINGNPLPVQTRIVNPLNEPVSASAATSNAAAQAGAAASPEALTPDGKQIMINRGVVPSVDSAATTTKGPSPVPEATPKPGKENVVVSQETVSYATRTVPSAQPTGQSKLIYSQKSVLERFRIYKGERSPKTLIELFNQEPLIGFRQDPPIVLSDGKATVKISFIAMPAGKKNPDIKVTGATLLFLTKDPDNTNTWIAELRPDKKTLSATLVVSQEKVNMEFPIVVAPEADIDLDKSGTMTEADFTVFLRDRGPGQKPLFDLNGDGKRDFVDDYIFTVNYIVKKPVVIK